MAVKQVTTPNINIGARRGWCLQYVDDAVNAPNRQPSAEASFSIENNNGNIRTSQFPVGVWVPGYLHLTTGQYASLGHVFWAYNHGNGDVEIHDSEVHAGARGAYHSVAEVIAWFGAYRPTFAGWSLWVDGVQAAEEVADPTPGTLKEAKGTATVTVDSLNVRTAASTDASIAGSYSNGETFNYDNFIITGGYVWLSYISYSGERRYVAEGPDNNDPNDVYVSGGVS